MGDESLGLLQFRMLGPLEAWRGGTPLRLGGERQRALLALLLVHANELVRTEQLVDQLLGEGVSDSALNTARVAVSRLRRLLENGDAGQVLMTQAGGYMLRAGPGQLDVALFERLMSDGRALLGAGDAALAASRLREALALWRGPALADLALLEFVQPEVRRLEELRLLAWMERIDADLVLGADSELIGELEGLVASNPLQERLRAQLMLALYRAGRQAEALEVYRRVSELLRKELGLEPGRGLQELERRVLRHDPALELAPDPVTTPASATEERAVCPYKGLACFDRSDAEYFCGRERMVSDLVARLAESTVVGIVGPSGIGKSSLLRAGLLSALSAGALPGSGSWREVLLRPGERPCAELARALGGEELDVVLSRLKPGDRLVVAVDQLEELFTVCEQEGDRRAFVDRLAAAACDTERRVLILVALRADFYGRCASYTRFAELLSSSHVLVGPMRPQELAQAIEMPAARAGLDVERALVEDLVADVAGEPGGLPMLSTMLLELWRVRDGRVLRVERYVASGGVRGAVARLAEDAYARLDEAGQRVARGLLLRLAHGEEGALVRRRLPLAELERIDGAEPVLAALTDARLLTASDREVEISHEALLQEWPRYRAWLEEDRVGRRLHAHLTESSRGWDAGGRDSGDLYRGARLTAALDWSAQHRDELSPVERAFVQASRSAAGRAARRLRGVLAGVAVLLVISLIAGVIALVQKQHATTEARVGLARQLGVQAVIEPRIDLAMLLAREAVHLDRSQQTESALLATLLRSPAAIASLELPIGVRPLSLRLSPDGRTLLVFANDGTLYIYDAATLRQRRPPIPGFNGDLAPVYSPDGSLLLLSDGSGPWIDVLDADTFRRVSRLRFDRRFLNAPTADNPAESLFMSRDGRTVYYAYAEVSPSGQSGAGYLDRWALPSGRLLSSSRVSTRGLVAIRLVDNGTRVVVLGDTAAQTLDARTLAPLRAVAVNLPAQLSVDGEATCCLESVAAINPDGTSAAVGSPDGTILFIDLSTGAIHAAAGGHTANVQSVRYSANGRKLVSTADDDNVVVWDARTAQPLETLVGHAGRPTDSTSSADGHTLYTSSLDGTVIEWDLGSHRRFGRPFTTGAQAPSFSVPGPLTPPLAISPDGLEFAAQTAASNVGIFSVKTLQPQTSLTLPRAATITTLAWSHGGSELAVGADHRLVQLWDVSGAPHLVRVLRMPRPASHFVEGVQSVAFSADDRLLAASDSSIQSNFNSQSGRIAIWRTRTRTGAPVTTALKFAAPVNDVAFSRDGRLLAVALGDGRVLILDSSNGTQIRTIHPLQGDNGGTISLAFAPNGTLATGTYAGVVQLWNPSTGAPISHPVLVAAAPVASIAFDRSGQRFATAGGPEGGLKLWFTSSLQQDGATLDPEQGTSGNGQFTPNGQLLLAVNANGHGSLWPVNPATLENHACAVAGRNLTHEEWSRFITGYRYSQVCP